MASLEPAVAKGNKSRYEVVLPAKTEVKLKKLRDETVDLLVKGKTGWGSKKTPAVAYEAGEKEAEELFLGKNVRALRWKS